MRAPKILASSLLAVMLTAGAASAGGDGYKPYRGKTSQPGRMALYLHKHATVIRLSVIDLEVALTCEDATVQYWGFGIGWSRGPKLIDRALAVDFVEPDLAFHVSGTVGPYYGHGHLSMTIPALTADEQAQLCTTGDLTWAVHRSDVPAPSTSSHALNGTIKVKFGAEGTATVKVIPS